MENAPVISLKNVWKTYKLGKVDVHALRGASLEIKEGTFVTIMGPSGSGKSTLLNMIGLLDAPTQGEVFLGGENTEKFSADKLSQMRGKTIGFIFQQFNLLQNLTALENITMPMVFQNTSEKERIERGIYLLELVDLKPRMNHLPMELSGGERQRVAIARAFANKPKLVIADEPTGNLDSQSGERVMKMLTKFHQEEKGTLVVVTHDPMIADYSEHVVHIKDGQIVKNHSQAAKVLWKQS